MPDDTTTGIAHPDEPDRWLVPPWPAAASFSEVVRHFLRFHPWGTTNTTHLLTYFEGYEAALNAVPPDKIAHEFHQRWCDDMSSCIRRCAHLYREKRAAEKGGNVSPLRETGRSVAIA